MKLNVSFVLFFLCTISLFGQQKIRLASQDEKRVWKMKQEKISPNYTTKLSDVITIKL
jgi:DNA polymerase V